MKLETEPSFQLAGKVLTRVKQLLAKEPTKGRFTGVQVSPFNNCREQGYVLVVFNDNHHAHNLHLAFARQCTSDHLIVVYKYREREPDYHPVGDNWPETTFRTVEEAAAYIAIETLTFLS